jgi:uncharacterized repeat protein (TIGR02059 family)
VLTFSETLGATGPSASAFTVTVDGVTLTVTSVTIVGATVVIVTSPKIEAGKAATIVYNAPSLSSATSNSAIQDAIGNDAAGATFTVSSANNASTYDPTPPTQTGSAVNDAGKLVISYSENLATPGPDASQFTVTIDGKTATIVSVEIVDNKISTLDSNSDLELSAAGTGRVLIPNNNLQVNETFTVLGTTNLQDTNVTGTLTLTGDANITGNVVQNGDLSVSGAFFSEVRNLLVSPSHILFPRIEMVAFFAKSFLA